MSYEWGPHYFIPANDFKSRSGIVQLREYYDEQLLNWELEALSVQGKIQRVNNPWYCRLKDSKTWVRIGESDNKDESFAVSWDTNKFPNGIYELMGLMHVFVSDDNSEKVVASQNVIEIEIKN
jgi:hypothetical protein